MNSEETRKQAKKIVGYECDAQVEAMLEDIGKFVNGDDEDAIVEEDELDDNRKENEIQHAENDDEVGTVSKNKIKKKASDIKKQLEENKTFVEVLGMEQSKIISKLSLTLNLKKKLDKKLTKFFSFCK